MRLRSIVLALVAVIALTAFWLQPTGSWPIRNSPPGAGPIVCFGDSLTRGFGADPDQSYPAVLAGLLGREVVNRGRNGDTSQAALERLGADVLSLSPSVVIVTLGGNDMLRQVPIEATERALREAFERLLAGGAMVVYLALDAPLIGSARMEKVRGLCRQLGVLYLDGVMEGIWKNPRLLSDRIHPNAAGYRLMAQRLQEALRKRL